MILEEARSLRCGDVIYQCRPSSWEAEVTAIGQQGISVQWTKYGSYAWLTWADLEGFQMEKP